MSTEEQKTVTIEQFRVYHKQLLLALQAAKDAKNHLLWAAGELYPLEYPFIWIWNDGFEIWDDNATRFFTVGDSIQSADESPVPFSVADALMKRWRDQNEQ